MSFDLKGKAGKKLIKSLLGMTKMAGIKHNELKNQLVDFILKYATEKIREQKLNEGEEAMMLGGLSTNGELLINFVVIKDSCIVRMMMKESFNLSDFLKSATIEQFIDKYMPE